MANVVCDLQGRKINFTSSKTLVGRCRDRPWRSFGLPECEQPQKNEKKRKQKKKQENMKINACPKKTVENLNKKLKKNKKIQKTQKSHNFLILDKKCYKKSCSN